jgi:hypothetical protein
MKGTVLGFSAETGEGVINGEDTRRYKFGRADWRGDTAPRAGAAVDFETGEDGKAVDIYPALSAFSSIDTSGVQNALGKVKSDQKTMRMVGLIAAGIAALLLLFFVIVPVVQGALAGLGSLGGGGQTLRNGQTVEATLDDSDSQSANRRYDRYTFRGRAGETVMIQMNSAEFDTVLLVGTDVDLSPSNPLGIMVLEQNDDGGLGSNSRLMFTPPSNGQYVVLASSYGRFDEGAYSLTLTEMNN